jgi:hypothetical protein
MATQKYDEALAQNPGKIVVFHCDTCGIAYDVREVSDEIQHPHALHVMAFTCPKGHREENRRLWRESQEHEKSELARLIAEVGADLEKREKEKRQRHFCLTACIWAEVKFCGVRDGLCYFEVWYDSDSDGSDDSDDTDHPPTLLSVPVPVEGFAGQAAVEQMIKQIGAEIERNEP